MILFRSETGGWSDLIGRNRELQELEQCIAMGYGVALFSIVPTTGAPNLGVDDENTSSHRMGGRKAS